MGRNEIIKKIGETINKKEETVFKDEETISLEEFEEGDSYEPEE